MDKKLFSVILILLILILIFLTSRIDSIIDSLDKNECCSCSVKLN